MRKFAPAVLAALALVLAAVGVTKANTPGPTMTKLVTGIGDFTAVDYKGADGLGDQGMFLKVAFKKPDENVVGYTIWREVGADKFINYFTVEAGTGTDSLVTALVATYDSNPARWAVKPEHFSDGATLLEATLNIATRASETLDGINLATVTGQALLYVARGTANPADIKTESDLIADGAVISDIVAAIDDIAPRPASDMHINETAGGVHITWMTSPDDGMIETSHFITTGLLGYRIYRGADLIATISAGDSTFTDMTPVAGNNIYSIVAFDSFNESAALTDSITVTAGITSGALPISFGLAQNFPNPFNPETTIGYQVPGASHVRLDVYNMLGQVVKTFTAEHVTAGNYQFVWDATDNTGSRMASGTYFYRLNATTYDYGLLAFLGFAAPFSGWSHDFTQTRKMTLVQ